MKTSAIATGILLLSLARAPDSTAQVVIDWPLLGLGSTPGPTDCSDAPPACQGLVFSQPGTAEVFVYPSGELEEVSSFSFALSYPEDWSVVSAEVCYGVVTRGNIYILREGVTMAFSPCVSGWTPVLRFIIIAPSVGRLESVPGPDPFGYTACFNGQFRPYGYSRGYVDFGNVCGGFPLRNPCDFCTLQGFHIPILEVDPPSLEMTVPSGQIGTSTVSVTTGFICQPLPECSNLPTWCHGTLRSRTDWLSFSDLGQGLLEVRADATYLPPGTYEGLAEAEGGGCCDSVCWSLLLSVTPPTTSIGEVPGLQPVSWGQIKTTYE